MAIEYSDIEFAIDIVSSGYQCEHSAYLDKLTGKIYYDSDGFEDVMPDDLNTNDKYIKIPSTMDFGLGKPLALEFARGNLPSDLELVYKFFNSKGAYSKFKSLLENRDALEDWYTYEQKALARAIKEWCVENEIRI